MLEGLFFLRKFLSFMHIVSAVVVGLTVSATMAGLAHVLSETMACGPVWSCVQLWPQNNSSTSILFPLCWIGRKSEPCKEEIRFLVSWYNLPCARNYKPLFEFQILPTQNYPTGTSEIIPLAPTRIYVEIVCNVEIFSLAWNYPAGTSELFLLGANLCLGRNLNYVEISLLACKFGST